MRKRWTDRGEGGWSVNSRILKLPQSEDPKELVKPFLLQENPLQRMNDLPPSSSERLG